MTEVAALPSASRRRELRTAARRLLLDPYVAHSAALVVPVALIAVGQPATPVTVGALVTAFIGIQLLLSLVGSRWASGRHEARWSAARFVVSAGFVTAAQLLLRSSGILSIAYLPVVGLAATYGRLQVIAVGLAAVAGHVTVEFMDRAPGGDWMLRGLAFGAVVATVAGFTRLEVGGLGHARDRLREAVQGGRRRSRQIAGVEAIGEILASAGPTAGALDEVVGRISRELGYRYVSIYLGDVTDARLGAQRGYVNLVPSFDGQSGVVGRVMRTRRPALVTDVMADPDYRSANPDVRSEICVPLLAEGEFRGFINVESTAEEPLDATDLRVMSAIADRIAAALILGHERQRLAERGELFRHLHEFSEAINGTLDEEQLYRSIVRSVPNVVPADLAALCILERKTGRYLLRALEGADEVETGIEVRSGEGMAGRAIRDRTLVIDPTFSAASYPAAAGDVPPTAPMQAASVPLIRDKVVVGALTVLRRDPDRAFSELDRDALAMLAEQSSLAVANVFLHADVAELAIRDPLTGLFNRRYLDPALEQLFAQRGRLTHGERPALSVVMFDLDHFSDLNNAWGHQVGDAALRAFAGVLRGRMRATDLVARFGGEEFVAILYRADLDDALRVAEEVRAQFASTPIEAGDEALYATVSAGCAAASDETDTPEALLRAADVALYMAKRAGRDRVVAA